MLEHEAVKAAAVLHTDPDKIKLDVKQAAATSSPQRKQEQHSHTWYDQERQQQLDEPAGGASTSAPQATPGRQREHVKFAASGEDSSGPGATQQPAGLLLSPRSDEPSSGATTARGSRFGFFSFTAGKRSADEGLASRGQQPGESSINASAASCSRLQGPSAAEQQRVGWDPAASSRLSGRQAASSRARAPEAGPQAQSEGPSRSQSVMLSGMSATLKGLLGEASSRILGSLLHGNSFNSGKHDVAAAEEEEELWFTSLDDFKPICHMLHRGRYMTAYFACAHKTGQHFVLKKFDKHKMLPAEERGVRRSIAFSELFKHPNLVKMMGNWESEDIIYVAEEYVNKGDILNDCISHPDKYTERHVAVVLVKPLLQALVHLHANNIIHRSVLPENAYMGLDDVLRLGHLTLAIDQTSDRPRSRTTLLDYMAPEMLSIRAHDEHELALLAEDSEADQHNHQQQQEGRVHEQPQQHQHQHQKQAHEPRAVPPSQLGLLGSTEASDAAGAAAEDASSSPGHCLEGQQQAGSKWMQQPAQLEPSRQSSLEDLGNEGALESGGLEGCLSLPSRSASLAFLGLGTGDGRAEWEQRDHYDEKVDIWQVGCLVHELLCGSMPFELESKLESAGLALWADIEVLPGSIPPDCTDFVQQALTKSPKLRPSAKQLLQHPWLARCEAGEPWRDPLELAAARREAELATVSGWLRHHWAAGMAALSGAMQLVQRGSRVAPLQVTAESHHQQPQQLPLPPQQQQSQQGAAYGGSQPGVGVGTGTGAAASSSMAMVQQQRHQWT